MIKVIAFDYAGVIIPGPMTQWVKNNLQESDEKWKIYNESARKWDLGQMSLDEVYKILSDITGIPANQIWDNFYLKADLNKDVVEIIKRLKINYRINKRLREVLYGKWTNNRYTSYRKDQGSCKKNQIFWKKKRRYCRNYTKTAC